MLNHFYIISYFHLYPFHLGEPKISQALCQDACQYLLVIASQRKKSQYDDIFQASLADASVHEFPHHLRDHFIMEAVAIARLNSLSGFLFKDLSHHHLSPLRNNWLKDNHIIGRLLKPHTKNTIFINFAARNTLVAEQFSAVQLMFSVLPYRVSPF